MKIKVLVELDIESTTMPIHSDETIKAASVEAVNNAVKMGEDIGFNHDLADDISITVMDVSLVQ
jgi:hypothetical protein